MESNLERLEIKIHVVGLEYLDLNTREGGSLSENVWWKCRHVLMALSHMEKGMEGYIYPPHKIQPLHTFDPTRSDRIGELGETNSIQNVNVRNLGGTDMINSVGPMC